MLRRDSTVENAVFLDTNQTGLQAVISFGMLELVYGNLY
jgi:hypothetical protein